MVAIRDAVTKARSTLGELLPGVEGVQLEEVLVSDDERYWKITLSYLAPIAEDEVPPRSIYAEALRRVYSEAGVSHSGVRLIRNYKSIVIDRKTGEFHEMKIREFPGE